MEPQAGLGIVPVRQRSEDIGSDDWTGIEFLGNQSESRDGEVRFGPVVKCIGPQISDRRVAERAGGVKSLIEVVCCSPYLCVVERSEEHTSELQSPYVISYAV